MSQDDLTVRIAIMGIVIASAANNIVKGGMAAAIGGRVIGRRVGIPLVASAVGGLLAAWFWVW
jgi:uncharacterized membrane protein (DUF4010 family)